MGAVSKLVESACFELGESTCEASFPSVSISTIPRRTHDKSADEGRRKGATSCFAASASTSGASRGGRNSSLLEIGHKFDVDL